MTGLEWLDGALSAFAETVTAGMHAVVLGIADLFWDIRPTGDDLQTARELITKSTIRDVSLELGCPLTEEERTAVRGAVEYAFEPVMRREGDPLESIQGYMDAEFGETGPDRVKVFLAQAGTTIAEEAALVVWMNWLHIKTAFYGAVIMEHAGVLGGIKAATLSAARDLGITKAGLATTSVYATPLIIAFAANELLGTGESATLLTAGRAKLQEARNVAEFLMQVPQGEYGYKHIANLYSGWLLVRDAEELFFRSYDALAVKNENVIDKMNSWQRLVESHAEGTWLTYLEELLIDVAVAAYKESAWEDISVPYTWQFNHDDDVVQALMQETEQ